ncbi:hypothetical protein E1A91_D08G126300v1 [Gossypium mustelinum]|uniref:Uncharacterized protein n=1 Tax=Gossypium mustelinum TaxID=34275 RepID=A0A5D2TVD4_GOSMU|nr:hypothetical protein E1A91_D08G126300v1 [Gossypium mustelinum]
MWIFLVKKYLHFVVYSCLQDRSKWFGELPWEESLQDAHEFGKLILFSNLDPAYSSAEVEGIVWNAFNELAEQRWCSRLHCIFYYLAMCSHRQVQLVSLFLICIIYFSFDSKFLFLL